MNPLEIFKATVSHEPHDGWLCRADFTPELLNIAAARYGLSSSEELIKYFGMKRWTILDGIENKDTKPEYLKYFSDFDIPEGSFINNIGVLEVPSNYYHFTGYISPLRNAVTLKDIEDFPYISAENFSYDHIKSETQQLHSEGLPVAGMIGHLYENAWQIRGYEEFLADMLAQPEICEYIFDKLLEKNLYTTKAMVSAGVDLIITADDVASQKTMMFSPDIWRKYLKSRWSKVYELARSINPDIQIWYHSDGNIMDIIPELIDIGVTILNPVQPECMDVDEVKKKFGKNIVLDGTIGTQTVMPFGTADDVKNTVRHMKEIAGYDGALILSPTHILEPEVPFENIEAFFEACAE